MNNFAVDYIVKEKEGVVVCIISDCEFNAVAMVDEYTDVFVIPWCQIPLEYRLNEQYKGVAKCMPGDIFNEEYGKKVAYRKAYLKYATALEKKVKLIESTHREYTESLQKKFDLAVKKINGKTETAQALLNKILEEQGNETA